MKRILLVDDEKSLLQIFKSLLIAMNFEVDIASTKIEANKLFNNHYDKLFIDYFMYDETTLDLIEKACDIYGSKNVCVVSGINNKKVSENIGKIGVKKILKKPILATQFIDFINEEKE